MGRGSITGPSLGVSCFDDYGSARGAEAVGFDAGSLEQYLIFRAFQIEIPARRRSSSGSADQ